MSVILSFTFLANVFTWILHFSFLKNLQFFPSIGNLAITRPRGNVTVLLGSVAISIFVFLLLLTNGDARGCGFISHNWVI